MKLRRLRWPWAAGGAAVAALVTIGAALQATGDTTAHRAAAAAPATQPSHAPAPAEPAARHGAVLTQKNTTTAPASSTPVTTDPYAPAYHHSYRHGAVPTKATARKMLAWQATKAATSASKLVYGGGIDGIGVTSAPPKVYLVFWGSQWGTAGTDSSNDITLSGDPSGEAPYLQEFFKGLGTGGERWSGVMTQYCQGVVKKATSCPATSTQHVGYPSGDVLAGVWYDSSGPEPSDPSLAPNPSGAPNGNQLATEAVAAAAHFGNTTKASNRDAQYIIASPAGADPDQWLDPTTGFCAWHDDSSDGALTGGPATSPYGDIAFTNLPYQTDAGQSCGQNFVNAGGTGALDGVSIVAGHEYAETLTDQNPPGGWTYSGNSAGPAGSENGDLCAWFPPGTRGGSADLATATGEFAIQSTWANDDGSAGGCETGHTIVGSAGASAVTVKGPRSQITLLNKPVSWHVSATESGAGSFTYSASGLPPGTSLDPATGAITGTPDTVGSYPVTLAASDGAGGTGQATFTWTVAVQLLGNPGFENSATSIKPWTASTGVLRATSSSAPAHSGNELARLGGKAGKSSASLAQTVTISKTWAAATFSFYLDVISNDPRTRTYDTLKVEVLSSSGSVLKTLATYSNRTATGYGRHSFSMTSYRGRKISIKFIGTQTLAKHTTSFLVDDTGLYAS